MPITFKERLGMWMRKTPIKSLEEALEIARSNGIQVSLSQLEAHYLAGGKPSEVLSAMVIGKEHDISVELFTLFGIDLSGHDVRESITACLEEQEYIFDHFTPESPHILEGFTKAGEHVKARCMIKYRLPIHHVYGWSIDSIQEKLSSKIGMFIFTAGDYMELKRMQSMHEAKLLVFATESSDSVKAITLDYIKGKGSS